MENSAREKIKLYMVVVLAVIFIAVGYYRFFYDKKKSQPTAAATPDIQLTVPELAASGSLPEGRPAAPVAVERPRAIRDIFSSGEAIPADNATEESPLAPMPPSFSLKGTIVAGRHPIAVINNRFVRAGDRIDGYRVVKIDKKKVWLQLGSHKFEVETMPHD